MLVPRTGHTGYVLLLGAGVLPFYRKTMERIFSLDVVALLLWALHLLAKTVFLYSHPELPCPPILSVSDARPLARPDATRCVFSTLLDFTVW